MRINFLILAAWLCLVFTAPASTNYLTTGAGTPRANGYFYPFTNGIYAGTNAFIWSGPLGSFLSDYAAPSATNTIVYFPPSGPPLIFPAPARGSVYAPRTNYGGTNLLTFYTAPSTVTNTVTNWPALLEYNGRLGSFSVVLKNVPDSLNRYPLTDTNYLTPLYVFSPARYFAIFTRDGDLNALGDYWRLQWPRGDHWQQFELYNSIAGVTNPPAGQFYYTDILNGDDSLPDSRAYVTTLGPVTNNQTLFILGSRVIFNLNGTASTFATATNLATNNVVLFAPPAGLYFNPNANPASGYWVTTGGSGRAPKLTQFDGPNPFAATNVTELWQTNKPTIGGEPLFKHWLETNTPPALGQPSSANLTNLSALSGLTESIVGTNGLTYLFTNGLLCATSSGGSSPAPSSVPNYVLSGFSESGANQTYTYQPSWTPLLWPETGYHWLSADNNYVIECPNQTDNGIYGLWRIIDSTMIANGHMGTVPDSTTPADLTTIYDNAWGTSWTDVPVFTVAP